jgi:hypothetical protein
MMLLKISLFVLGAAAQSIGGLGVSGGDGPRGGIGDGAHPVMKPQAFITDAKVPTRPNSTRQLAEGPAPKLVKNGQVSTGCTARRNVRIDSSTKGARQEMLGFGHAWTGSTVSVLGNLEPDVFDQVMKDLYSQDGNNMGFMRHTIGSSDLDGNQYSYDDNGPSFNLGEPDLELSHFAIGPHGTAMAKMIARVSLLMFKRVARTSRLPLEVSQKRGSFGYVLHMLTTLPIAVRWANTKEMCSSLAHRGHTQAGRNTTTFSSPQI